MRKHDLDNIRWSVVILVVIYHVCYHFNSSGVIKNVDSEGIPQADALLPFVYPWFMALLFLVAGISARYALLTRSKKEFMKERAVKLLLPAVSVCFLLGWTSSWVTSQYVDLFGGYVMPLGIRYVIFAMIGIGPLWFLHELFLASAVLVLLLWVDKKGLLVRLGEKANLWAAFFLFFTVWGASQICNTPLITVYRGVYVWVFLLGYYVFSNEKLREELRKVHWPLLLITVFTGIVYTIMNYGKNYAEPENLKTFFTNLYAWLGILTVLSCYRQWFDLETPITRYLSRKSFSIYVLHGPVMVLIVYSLTEYVDFPLMINYMVTLCGTFLFVYLLDAAIQKVPPLRFLMLGQRKN
ncbi:MAG: acyltransferase [Lachnospiraceae bacterium]